MAKNIHALLAEIIEDEGKLTEESVWAAIAEANGLDYEDIADGDLTEWL